MYKLLKDKSNEFKCEIQLEGTSSPASVRLFLEGDGCEISFDGNISENICSIPMGRLKKYSNLLENGKIRLEVVVDDTLFIPYTNTYELSQGTTVEIKEISKESNISKPSVTVRLNESPENILKKYLSEHTSFDGTVKSLKLISKNQVHKDKINEICKLHGVDRKEILTKLIT